jgi:hypothetical protein
MSVHWQVEYPHLQLHGQEVVWTMKNAGDEPAHAGTHVGDISITRRPGHDDEHIDPTPWVNPLTLDRDVAPQTAHTMHFPVTWAGQQPGSYVVKVTLGDGVEVELYIAIDIYGNATIDHG